MAVETAPPPPLVYADGDTGKGWVALLLANDPDGLRSSQSRKEAQD
jgi:hypothetical protein